MRRVFFKLFFLLLFISNEEARFTTSLPFVDVFDTDTPR